MGAHTNHRPARSPEDVHAVLERAFNDGDLDAFTDAYEPDATLVSPPDGRVVRGHDAIHAASAAIVTAAPRATIRVQHALQADDLALTQARWHLVGRDPYGGELELDGFGTIVSRRQSDGSWRIVMDNPMGPRRAE
jgi:uncharacterized protein (TIGR02246 family)